MVRDMPGRRAKAGLRRRDGELLPYAYTSHAGAAAASMGEQPCRRRPVRECLWAKAIAHVASPKLGSRDRFAEAVTRREAAGGWKRSYGPPQRDARDWAIPAARFLVADTGATEKAGARAATQGAAKGDV